MAEYLLAEVLDRQPEQVRRLLLRTSVLERVNGELADLLTGDSGGERVLQDLEEANAFVVALDAARSWFRYHHLFADLLQLELRRTAPGEVAGAAPSGRRAGSPGTGTRWRRSGTPRPRGTGAWPPGCSPTTGPACTWTGRPPPCTSCWPGSRPRPARRMPSWRRWPRPMSWRTDRWRRRSGTWAWRSAGSASVPDAPARAGAAAARGRPAAAGPAAREPAGGRRGSAATAGPGRGPGRGATSAWARRLRALALISLGSTEFWAARFEEAERHLEQGLALARRIGRPFLEFTGLAYQAAVEIYQSLPRAAERSRQAIELAERHGWTDEPAAGVAYMILGAVLAWQGGRRRQSPGSSAPSATSERKPSPRRCWRCSTPRACSSWRAAGTPTRWPHSRPPSGWPGASPHRTMLAHADPGTAAARPGAPRRDRARRAGPGRPRRTRPRTRGDAHRRGGAAARPRRPARGARRARAGPGRLRSRGPAGLAIQAFLLEAIARDALGDPAAADRALERALDLAEPDGALLSFLLYPAPGLLERHARHRTAHAALIAEILGLLAGTGPRRRPPGRGRRSSR